jgi:bifunctional N-acetylglucosamine-1-phosphate-uridyltransferase/glucosamine-1-phosphate-acetyltransferase GlmU-like protein
MADLFIIAAGVGSRMGGDVPKALVPITNIPNLTTTLQQSAGKFDYTFVVANIDIKDKWEAYSAELKTLYPKLHENLHFVYIRSGLGDGHAVMEGLVGASYQVDPAEDIVICWGDVFFQHGEIFDELLDERMHGAGLVPLQYEVNPYVHIETLGDLITGAKFSKHGEVEPSEKPRGHDQSIFRFRRSSLLASLQRLHAALYRNGKYMTGELSLLYVFHELHQSQMSRSGKVHAYKTKYPTLSFNTQEEVKQIQEEISKKWTASQS